MKDLKIYTIPLEKVTLQRIDPHNKEHKKAIAKMRDRDARRMMFDVKQIYNDIKHNRELGNSFLVKDKEQYIGYIYISNNRNNKERGISYMIEKSVRNKGYGKILLTCISEYLFERGLANSLVLYIKDKNKKSVSVAESCGFEREGKLGVFDTSKYRKSR